MKKIIVELKTLRRGIGFLFEVEKKYAFLLFVTSVLSVIPTFITVNMMSMILNELCGHKNLKAIILYVSVTVFGNLVISLSFSALGHLKGYYNNLFIYNEQMHIAKKMADIDLCVLEDRNTTLLFEQIKDDTRCGHNMYYLCRFLEDEISSIANIIISFGFFISLFLLKDVNIFSKIIIGLFIAVSVTTTFFSDKNQGNVSKDLSDKNVTSNSFFYFYDGFYDDYHAGKDVRLFNMGELVCNEQKKQCAISFNLQMDAQKRIIPFGMIKTGFSSLLNVILYTYLIIACVRGAVSVGDITRFVSFVLLFVNSSNSVLSKIHLLFNNNYYLRRYFKFLDMGSETKAGTIEPDKRHCHNFEFKNVSFKYPNSNNYAIKDLSIKFNLNNRIAIVGMNGSGKSTFVKLLCGLYTPTKGQILMDGIDIESYNYEAYKSLFSCVFQNFKLYAYPLSYNVASSDSPNRDKVLDCLLKTGLNELIDKMNGIDKCIYKEFDGDGFEISGGEAQKIALSRAIYRRSSLIILDEPTAALDPIAEYDVYNSFNKSIKDRPAIFISHRLSSCRFCNEIFVFDKGMVVQRGTHDELKSNKEGKYYDLWYSQAKYYNEK